MWSENATQIVEEPMKRLVLILPLQAVFLPLTGMEMVQSWSLPRNIYWLRTTINVDVEVKMDVERETTA